MKKSGWPLAISLAVTLVMGGAFLASLIEPPRQGASPPSARQAMATQVPLQALDKISVENPSGSFALENLGDRLSIQDWNQLPLNEEALNRLAELCCSLPGEALTGSVQELGLQNPRCRVTVEAVGRGPVEIFIGSSLPSGSVACQVDGQLWSLSAEDAALFFLGREDYLSLFVTPPQKSGTQVLSVTLSGSARPQPIQLEKIRDGEGNTPPQYQLTAPTQELVAGERVTSWALSAFGLEAQKAAVVNPTPLQVEEYGLGEPFSILDLSSQEDSFTLFATRPREGNCYLMREGVPIIYQVEAAKLPWLTVQLPIISGNLLEQVPLEELASLQIRTSSGVFDFRLEHDGSQSRVTLGGEQKDLGSFEELYLQLTLLHPVRWLEEAPEPAGETVLWASITYTGDFPSGQLSLEPLAEDDELLLELNGLREYTVSAADFDRLTELLEEIWHGQDG